jgi:hypothetical protein
MSKIGSHHSFRHLKHNLWPKEGPWVRLAIWLPTIKSQESTRFCCMQVACDTSLESFWRGIQLFFKLHFNSRSARKVMGPQSWDKVVGVSTLIILWLPLENLGTKSHLDVGPWAAIEYIIRGRWWLPPSAGRAEFCEFELPVARPSTKKCSNYALITLCWFCAGMCE